MSAPAHRAAATCSKSFGKTEIIRGVNLTSPQGERHALIGPNGAGKSTLFNLISGRFAPTSGEIALNGEAIDGLPPHEINRLGLSRSFQITKIFPRLTRVREPALRACCGRWAIATRSGSSLAGNATLNERAEQLLERDRPARRGATCRPACSPMPSSARWRSASPSPAAPTSSCSTSRPPA